MTVNPEAGSKETAAAGLSEDAVDRLAEAYAASYRGPHGDAQLSAIAGPTDRAGGPAISPALIGAHYRLGHWRPPEETRVAVYAADDPAGFGPAIQIVTEHAAMLMDSVAVLLNRLGVAYLAIMSPVFRTLRSTTGELADIRPVADAGAMDGVDEEWIHIQLARSADTKAVAEAAQLLPGVLANARQVGLDAHALDARLRGLAHELDSNPGVRFPGPDRADVASLLRWLADGHFVLLGYQSCAVTEDRSTVDPASRLGVLRLRDDVLPPLTGDEDTLVLAQATVPSYLRYGAHPYIVVVREQSADAESDVEHRFVGLFTIAAMNSNVMEIPMISKRVGEALRLSRNEPGHPGQLLLDIIQTIPRPELFALSARELLDMAKAVVELGSRRRTLLFLRSDQLAHFVSCLVYLPRDRYTTVVRLAMQEILVRELGGVAIDYTARVSESPWAVVHFTVRMPSDAPAGGVDTSDDNEARIQDLLTEAARTWGDRLIGALGPDSIEQSTAEHYAGAFGAEYKQAVDPEAAIADIAIIEALTDDSVRLVLDDPGEDRVAQLTWYLGGRSASLSHLLPMLQSMGVVVLEERPFTVTRPDGLAVWIYQFKISPDPSIPLASDGPDREATAERFADAVTAIWHGRAEIDRFNELVLRADLNWPQVALLRAYARYLRQARFTYSQSHIESVLNDNPSTARSLVALFEALFDPSDNRSKRAAQQAAAAVARDIDALVSLDTDRVLRGFASLIQATLRTNYFVRRAESAREQGVLSLKLDPEHIDELPLPRPKFEIYVYSPRVEGVHLRFGNVARGGLRWSDRREDFRTEILGLVKAQAVKNAVIVPVGAKGGFVVKKPPLPTGDTGADRDATREEGVACYRLFIAGLLDVTDNVDKATGDIVPPT